jgi:hypothetical protein
MIAPRRWSPAKLVGGLSLRVGGESAPLLDLFDDRPPVWVRNLSHQLVVLQRPDDPSLMRVAAEHLWLHGSDWNRVAADLTRRADALEAGWSWDAISMTRARGGSTPR